MQRLLGKIDEKLVDIFCLKLGARKRKKQPCKKQSGKNLELGKIRKIYG